jgi:hypothetical protein
MTVCRSPRRATPTPPTGLTSGAESLTGGGTRETWRSKALIRAGTVSAGAAGRPVRLQRLEDSRRARPKLWAALKYSNARDTTWVSLAEL